ncbi:MAG: hypothetical protein GQ525_00385 [Draconibacterium sp.]|nr:hypothetical protein [Draconibacterium sp.]
MKNNSFFKIIIFGFICVFLVVSCTGPEGPMGQTGADGTNGINGADGKDGADGANGTDGTNGVDGNQACLTCHTQAGMDKIGASYASSMHGSPGFELGYAGVRTGCMECHSNEGFRYHIIGYDPESNLDFASKITCGTCHGDHINLEEGLTAPMRTDAAVLSLADGITVFDFESSSNTCANCHQARNNGTAYSSVDTVWNDDESIDFVVHEDSVWVSSSHAGPHYTTMTNNIFGVGGYTDSPGVVMGMHKQVGCVGCHMGESEGTNGGHTMVATLNACTTCHSTATDFDIGGTQTEIHAAEEELETALVAAGILDANHNTIKGIYSNNVFEAFWNYKIVHYDGSLGVHNPAYARALINDAKGKLGLN